MTYPKRYLMIGLICIGLQLSWAQSSQPVEQARPQGQRGTGARQAAPRGRSITLGDITNFEVKDCVFNIVAGPDQVRVIFYRDDIFRIWLGPDGEFTEAQPAPEDAQIVVYREAPIMVSWRDAGEYYRLDSGECVLRVYKRPLRFSLFDKDNAVVVWQEARPLAYGPSAVQTLRRGENENFYGGGMQNGYFSHRDTSVNIRLNTRGWGDGTTPNPAPFYMSTAGYGAFRNTMAPGRYDFLSPLSLSHDEARFDCYYFYGPSLKKILDGYTLITGRPFFPPRWGLEFGDADCYNKNGKTPDVISKVADVYRQKDMPGGWILPNDGYGCGYVDLDSTIQELHKRGFYTGLWTEKGLERIAQEVSVLGSRVMKLDVAWVGRGYQFALNGMRDAYEGIEKNSDARGFVWTTCAWSGAQRYATIWSGDQSGNWEYVRFHIPTVLGAGLSGFNAATGDVDGIFGGGAQTQVRDLQWKCLTPVFMIISGWSKQTNLMKQPWIFGEPYTSMNRKYLKLKMRLTPYIYSYTREAYDTGVPTVRAMVLEFPDDPVTWSKRTQYQFMSGEWLLVAPVYEDTIVRNDIYLPAGKWIDYWDGTEFNGPLVLNNYAAPLDKLPMFVKAGAIVPMYPEMLFDRDKPKDPVTLDVYPFGKTSFNLYEDDGVTQQYRTGAFARTLIEVGSPKDLDVPEAQITVKVGIAEGQYKDMPTKRSYLVDLHVPRKPADVKLAERGLAVFETKAAFESAPEGWFFDSRDRRRILHIKTKPQSLAGGFSLKVTM
ncbi:MAG TPA: TIM-barrel domain-containing protein [Candidatus Latescibacteria bacterium]|nr:TIM-barrel domain-containing protein [Candidatus Latescibacterota bacterium]